MMTKKVHKFLILLLCCCYFGSHLTAQCTVTSSNGETIQEGDPIVTGLTATCPPAPTPCAFDPNTMSISVQLTGTHTWVSDLGFYLQAPDGTVLTLAPNPGAAGQPGACNSGDDFNNLTFNNTGGGDFNVCTATTPLTGSFSSAYLTPIDWAAIAGNDVYGNWSVIIGDCVGGDVGILTNAVLTFSDNGGGTSCLAGQAPVSYNSGTISAAIDDGECTPGVDNPAIFQISSGVELTWWNVATGGTQQGMGSPLDPTGLTAEEGAVDLNTAGDYTFYAQCACADGGISPRVAVVLTVVGDGTPPVITCPASVTVECDESTDPANTGTATATDDTDPSPTVTFADVVTPGACPQESMITRTWTATDNSGNSSTCSQVITVDDSTPPVIVCPANVTIECDEDAGGGGGGGGSTTSGTYTGGPQGWGSGDTGPVATLTAEVSGLPPGAIVTDINVSLAGDHSWAGDLELDIVSPDGTTIRVLDDVGCTSGNTDNIDATFDDEAAGPPSASCTIVANNTPDASTCPANYMTGAGVTGTVQPLNALSGFDSETAAGTWTLNVNDDAGGDAGCMHEFSVNVEWTVPGNNLGGGGGGTGVATATDNCDSSPTISSSDVSTQGPSGCSQYEYTITRTWTATDACGNMSMCTQVITVDDSTPPVVSCPGNVTIECDESIAPDNTGGAGATDNCDTAPMVTFSDVTVPGSCPQESTITRTWTAMDACGNMSSCDQTITVDDSTPPTITCPANVTVECDESTDPSNTGTAVGTDACDTAPMVSFSDATAPGACPQELTITRTWTATDACGNSDSGSGTCTQVITVDDSTPPVIVCPANVTIECDGNTGGGGGGGSTTSGTYTGGPQGWGSGDTGPVATLTAEVSGLPPGAIVTDVTVSLAGDHSWAGDLELDIVSPDGTTVRVLDDVGCTSGNTDNIDATFDDAAAGPPSASCTIVANNTPDASTCPANYMTGAGVTGTVQPLNVLSGFDGETAAGTWTLQVNDDAGGDAGCMHEFSVDVEWTVPGNEFGDGGGGSNTGEATATDNCDNNPTVTFSDVSTQGPSGCSQYEYTITRTWTATDACGNAASCTQTITVDDSTPPVVTCPASVTVECDQPTDPSATGMATATDNCDSAPTVTFADVTVPGSCPQESTITRTWMGIDACGNMSSCDQTITVDDSTAPVITCPANAVAECDAPPSDTGTPTATDNCDSAPTFSFTDASSVGSCPQETVVTRTWVATDACGNTDSGSATCTQTITFSDTSPPMITCPANVTVECDESTDPGSGGGGGGSDSGTATATYAGSPQGWGSGDTGPVASLDAVVGGLPAGAVVTDVTVSLAGDHSWAGDLELDIVSPDGTIIRVLDDVGCTSGNTDNIDATFDDAAAGPPSASCTIVSNNIPDASTCPANYMTGAGVTGTVQPLNALSGFDGQNAAGTWTLNVNDDAGGDAGCMHEFSVTVAWMVPGGGGGGGTGTGTGVATATDNCDNNPTVTFSDVSTQGPSGCSQYEYTITRTWTATDACGNSATCSQVITVDDSTPPVVTCPANTTVECDASSDPSATGMATATDNCDTSPTVTFADATAPGACPQESTITRTWMGIDACGNMSSCTQTITVDDSTPPVITCPAFVTVECDESTDPGTGGGGGGGGSSGTATASYAGSPQGWGSGDTGPVASLAAVVSGLPTGALVTDVTVSLAGDHSWAGDLELDIISPDGTIIRVLDDVGCTSGNTDNIDATFDDAAAGPPSASCTIVSNNTPDASTCPANYMTGAGVTGTVQPLNALSGFDGQNAAGTWTLSVNDDAGGDAGCMHEFSVTVAWTMPGGGGGAGTGVATATDNCDSDPVVTFSDVSTQGTSGCSQYEYTITRTWTATDACGNAASCTQLIIVDDSTAPEITCPANTTVEFGDPTLPFATGDATATDNCSTDDEVTITFTDVSTQASGGIGANNFTITRTFTATDACGNAASCTQIITVEDTTPPVFVDPATEVTLVAAPGECSVDVEYPVFFVTDNGILADVTCTPEEGTTVMAGTTITVTCIATDVTGNSSQHTFTVTVEYNDFPLILCPDPQNIALPDTEETVAVFWDEPVLDASCPFTLQSSIPSGSDLGLGETIVTYTVLDGTTVVETCNFSVCVYDPLEVACVSSVNAVLNEDEDIEPVTWNVPASITGCPECKETEYPNFRYLGYYEGHQYFYSEIKRDWEDAQAVAEARESNLVSINSEGENSFLIDQIRHEEIYIGLNDDAIEGQLRWAGEDDIINPLLDYVNLDNDADNDNVNDFGILNDSGTWDFTNGVTKRHFIIERACIEIEVIETTGAQIDEDGLEVGTYSIGYLYQSICGGEELCIYDINVLGPDRKVANCETGGLRTDRFWLEAVSFGTGINISGDDEGYGDYSDQPLFFGYAGQSYGFSAIISDDAPDIEYYAQVWIDWNGDGDFFDENEAVLGGHLDGVSNSVISLAADLEVGEYNMRVQLTNQSDASPCGIFDEGEVEDYILRVIESSIGGQGLSSPGSKIFPNPTANTAYLQLDEETAEGTYLEVYSATGQRIMRQVIPTQTIGAFKIDLESHQLVSGHYQVRVVSPNKEAYTLPLVITK